MLCVGIDSGTPPKLQVTDRLFPAFFRLEGKPGTSITTAPALGPTETVSAAGQLSDEELALLASAARHGPRGRRGPRGPRGLRL